MFEKMQVIRILYFGMKNYAAVFTFQQNIINKIKSEILKDQ